MCLCVFHIHLWRSRKKDIEINIHYYGNKNDDRRSIVGEYLEQIGSLAMGGNPSTIPQ